MNKDLRIAFALGGGVSLGTFSSAALTEVLKQALVHGRDCDGNPYETVTIDVLSGASAGTISLALMLRFLSDPQVDFEGPKESAEDRLRRQFQSFDALPESRLQDLLVAQKAQDLMARLWVDELHIEGLTGSPTNRDDIRYQAGVLDRRRIEELARQYGVYDFPEGFPRRRLLADRVLLAASLTRLTPTLADARGELAGMAASRPLSIAAADALVSRTFDDLRIFDLYYRPRRPEDLANEPSRWCRHHVGKEQDEPCEPPLYDLRNRSSWSRLASTALASGSVPFAFEPVVLERRRHEFANWPKELAAHDRYPFSYVDGGTFRNEPLREAYRLASFRDQRRKPRSFDRWVVFIDPYLKRPEVDFRQGYLQRFESRPGASRVQVHQRPSLDRMVPAAKALVQSIIDQSKIIESNKAFRTRDRFQLRDSLRNSLRPLLREAQATQELEDLAQQILEKDRDGALLPNLSLAFKEAIFRIRQEENPPDDPNQDPATLSHLPANATEILFLLIDLLLDLDRKDPEARLVDIAPLLQGENGEEILFELPDARYFGFSGFTSPTARRVSRQLGRYCAIERLRASDLRLAQVEAEPGLEEEIFQRFDRSTGRPQPSYWQEFSQEFTAGIVPLAERFKQLLVDTRLQIPGSSLADLVGHFVDYRLRNFDIQPQQRTSLYELRIVVPDGSFEIDGFWWLGPDQKPIELGDGHFLLVHAHFDHNTGQWAAPQLEGDRLNIHHDSGGREDFFCSLELPSEDLRREADLKPFPFFELRIEETDQSEEGAPPLPANRWTVCTDVQALEL